jgi:superfamily II DNA/RNA helicase
MPNEPETYIHRIGRTGRAGIAIAAEAPFGRADRICV